MDEAPAEGAYFRINGCAGQIRLISAEAIFAEILNNC